MSVNFVLLFYALLGLVKPGSTSWSSPWPSRNRFSRRLEDANTPLEFCEAQCTCEECEEYAAEYKSTCWCEQQPDGSVLQKLTEECLSCVTDTDVCYLYNFTDTVKVSEEDGTVNWAGFYEECAVVGADEFCMSTADQNAPSPAPCKVRLNGVECNSCVDLFSDSLTLEMDCTNIVEGAFMKISTEGVPSGFVGSFEAAGIALTAADEYALCPGDPGFPSNDTSSSIRSTLRCITITASLVAVMAAFA